MVLRTLILRRQSDDGGSAPQSNDKITGRYYRFAASTAFVTPYAATGTDEYFAEALREWVEVNGTTSHWPRATKVRLRKADPGLFAYVERLFSVNFRAAA